MAIICMNDLETERVQSLMLPNLSQESDGTDQNSGDTVQILPIRLVKGLEFDAVILWNPDLKAADRSPGAAKLLYVAATRALHELYVINENLMELASSFVMS
jgi:DNA helicase-2/ATP-dependent DNA helicase PcrA